MLEHAISGGQQSAHLEFFSQVYHILLGLVHCEVASALNCPMSWGPAWGHMWRHG